MQNEVLIDAREAAKLAGQSVELMQMTLIQGLVPFGYAVKTYPDDAQIARRRYGRQYRYIIYKKRFLAYINGDDLNYTEPKNATTIKTL